MKKIPPILLLVAFFLQLTYPAFGAETYDGQNVAIAVTLQNDGVIRYNTGKYSFLVKKNETRPETVQVWKGPDDLKCDFNVADGTATDKGAEITRPITKSEKSAWMQEWEKLKKLVRVIDAGSYVDFRTERGRIFEFVSRASTGEKNDDVYVLKYSSEGGGGTKTFPTSAFKYRPPIDRRFELGMEAGQYVPVITGSDKKKFVPLD
ncbi:MAG: hypothetical protein EXS59_00650 [Candidatus Taylorbacteria bacterium]|nr:hypothetical protein [Candidatus Taylorbacteria bacterium]